MNTTPGDAKLIVLGAALVAVACATGDPDPVARQVKEAFLGSTFVPGRVGQCWVPARYEFSMVPPRR